MQATLNSTIAPTQMQSSIPKSNILVIEPLVSPHTCNYNYGTFETDYCGKPAKFWVGWINDFTRKFPDWKYASPFGGYRCSIEHSTKRPVVIED